MTTWRARFLDGPKHGEVHEWSVEEPYATLSFAPVRPGNNQMTLVSYSGGPELDEPWPGQVNYRLKFLEVGEDETVGFYAVE